MQKHHKARLKAVASVVILIIGNYLSFLTGRYYERARNYAQALAEFAYRVGFRDGVTKQLADGETLTPDQRTQRG